MSILGGFMSFNKNNKYIIRWGFISLVVICYFFGLIGASFSLSAFIENQSMQISDPVSVGEYSETIDSLMKATDNIFYVATIGFIICVPLILLIFNRVR